MLLKTDIFVFWKCENNVNQKRSASENELSEISKNIYFNRTENFNYVF